MAALNVRDLGDFIRDQRRAAQISLRQLARQAGVSNPYLSQIERGLRKPSAEILQQIAKALRISAEVLYVQAGILEERAVDTDVMAAVFADEGLTERQKQVVLDIYEAFRRENAGSEAGPGAPTADQAAADQAAAGPAPSSADPVPPEPSAGTGIGTGAGTAAGDGDPGASPAGTGTNGRSTGAARRAGERATGAAGSAGSRSSGRGAAARTPAARKPSAGTSRRPPSPSPTPGGAIGVVNPGGDLA